ncbi:methyltransferase domain-containing protein [Aristophania vespae]|uniref:methyltransferase domain-containing protein n=1 Tax=Aristophania vespae TaxID=2697033 RepID=UPI002351B1D8|nr:methyltransferase domain-containing protein [Aristophania vespae]UMM64186.1 Malonyl-[acyl-carrier protein] O-methyltransferase [Aristophania vespae]
MRPSRKKIITQHFNKADHYDSASYLQRESAHHLALLINGQSADHKPHSILEIGCGTGHLSQKLIKLYPESSFILSDLAPQMLQRAECKIKQEEDLSLKIKFHLMDGEKLDPPPPSKEKFDLIASNLCIQWFTDRPAALKRLSELLSPSGLLIMSTIAQGSFKEWQESCTDANAACGIPDYPSLAVLENDWPGDGVGKWTLCTIREPVPSALAFLRNLKHIGASLPHPEHKPVSITALQRAMTLFDRNHTEITYEIAFGVFRKDRL